MKKIRYFFKIFLEKEQEINCGNYLELLFILKIEFKKSFCKI